MTFTLNDTGAHQCDDPMEVLLDGWAFKLMAPLDISDLTRFQGRIITGAPSLTSNPLLSTWVISNLQGGHGIDKLEEGTDANRYRIASLYARIPKSFALPRYVRTITGTNDLNAKPLGDLYISGDYVFFADYGSDLMEWDEDTLSMVYVDTLGASSVNKAIEFQGTSGSRRLFIPQGQNGYSTYDGSAVASYATPLAQAYVIWADRLICLDVDGQLHWSVDGDDWTTDVAGGSYGPGGYVDPSFIAINLVSYYDRSGNPAVHVVTNRGVWLFDPDGPKLWQFRDFSYPPHPTQAAGSAVWRGSMYVSNGMGVTFSNGNLVNPGSGLDRDDGLPSGIRGYIQDLQDEYNGLYALVQGTTYASVHVWTSFGWHMEYCGTEISDPDKISWMAVSSAQGVSRLWWGENGDLKTFKLPTDFANPRALNQGDGTGEYPNSFSQEYTLETGRFDAEMENYVKVANTLELRVVDQAPSNLFFDYRIDGDSAYTALPYPLDPLNGITQTGTFVVPFGLPLLRETGYAGVPFYDIELRVRLLPITEVDPDTPNLRTPIIEYLALTYRQMIPGSYSWVATIDLSSPYNGRSPEQMRDRINDLVRYAGFFEMVYGNRTYRVCLSQQNGRDMGGHDHTGMRTVNILEVPQTGIAGTALGTVTIA